MSEKISEKIRVFGFFMTCAMVFYHCPTLDNTYAVSSLDGNANTFVSYIFTTMGMLVMSHFFVVTGFLMFHDFELSTYCSKIKRRVFSLLIPYILWQCIIAVLNVLQKQYEFSMEDFLRRTFLLERWPVDGAMWYVYAVFLLALVSPVILLIYQNKKMGWICVLVIIVLVEIRGRFTNPLFVNFMNYGYVDNMLTYLPCYLVGTFYGKFSNEDTQADSLVYAWSLLFLAFLLEGTFGGIIADLTIKMMPLFALYLLPVSNIVKDKQVYCLTFLIYAMHQPLIQDLRPYTAEMFCEKFSMSVTVCNIFTRCIVLVVDIALAGMIHWVLKKYAPKMLNWLTGGRF